MSKEKKEFIPIKLVLKDEYNGAGPLWKVDKDDNWENYQDSDHPKFDGGFYAMWFKPAAARKIAKKLGVVLEEV